MKRNSTTFKLLILGGILSSSTIFAQDYENIIAEYFISNSSKLKSLSLSSKEFTINNIDPSESLGGAVVHAQQTYNSIPVYQGMSTFLIKNNKVDYANENFISSFDVSKTKKVFKSAIDEKQLAKSLFSSLLLNANIASSTSYKIDEDSNSANQVNTELTYFPINNQLVLAMQFDFEEINSSNYWHILVDVETKEILLKENLTVFCQFDKGTFGHDDHSNHNHDSTILLDSKAKEVGLKSKNILAPSSATYNVFPFPVEAPTFGDRQLISDPWDLVASREGWHSDGRNSYTTTRGNNVNAYEDILSNNTPSYVTDGGTSRQFNFPLDTSSFLETYRDAAITNLFYANNKIHDIFYKFGFTESARNFQENNFELSGLGNDAVLAEARDGFGRNDSEFLNNANFATPSDGRYPRMQMYVWDPLVPPQKIKFYDPQDLVGWNVESRNASFGPYTTETPIVGDLEKSLPVDGCQTLTNNMTGKIAFIARGTCGFTTKVKNAEIAGAKSVIVYNADSTAALNIMGGQDPTITIPSALISYEDGQRILSVLNSGTTINLSYEDPKSKYIWLDASLDNGIIIHEYGHGISNRLTSRGFGCLNSNISNEQMGEGWSDFFALMLTNRPGDDTSVARGIGSFASAENIDGLGIRPAKYSPNFSINNYTYGRTNGMVRADGLPNAHSIGFVWATMLWDLHWKFVERYGYSSDVAQDLNSGSAKVLQLVMDGLKLQPCNPTFIDGRNAILAADAAKGGADRCMIWSTFAKRGLGENASAGSKVGVGLGINDQVEDFTLPSDCTLSTKDLSINSDITVYPNPAKNEVTVSSKTAKEKVNIQLFDISGKKVLDVTEKISSGLKLDVSKLINGVYIIKGKGADANFSQKLIIKK